MPLAVGELEVTRADVVEVGVAEDGVHRVFGAYLAAAAADDDREFRFVVDFLGVIGEYDIVVGAGDGGWELREDDGGLGDGHAAFDGVIALVESDADDLLRVWYRGAEGDFAQGLDRTRCTELAAEFGVSGSLH